MSVLHHNRPYNWGGIIGQSATVGILKTSLEKGKIAPCYMFSGTRGIGKTTLARVLAMGLNCKVSSDPCGECASCVGILNGSSLNITEIDAASNNGVDDARELITRVQYSPFGKRNVIILDECHQLTTQAQNALLKVLEEPPEKTTFILCTTEPQKLLDTVVSRAHHFQLRPLATGLILETLKNVEDLPEIEPGVLELIASLAKGSLRDGLSILGKFMSLDVISKDIVLESSGYASPKEIAPVLAAVFSKNPSKLLSMKLSETFEPLLLKDGVSDMVTDLLAYVCDKNAETKTPKVTLEWFVKTFENASDMVLLLNILNTLGTMPRNLQNPSLWVLCKLLSLC